MSSESARAARGLVEEASEWGLAAKRALLVLADGRNERAEQSLLRLFGNWRSGLGFLGLGETLRVAEAAEAAIDRLCTSEARPARSLIEALGRAVPLLEFAMRHPGEVTGNKLVVAESASLVASLRRMASRAQSIPAVPLSDLELFVSDSAQQLEACVAALPLIEKPSPLGAEAVNAAFRALHTFKSNASMVGYADLENLARAGENALGALRAGELVPSAELQAALLELLKKARSGLEVGSADWSEESSALARAVVQARHLARRTRLGELLIESNLVEPDDIDLALSLQREPLGQALVRLQVLSTDQLQQTLALQSELRSGRLSAQPPPPARRERVVPVDLRKLERLALRVEELEATHAMLKVHISQTPEAARAYQAVQRRLEALSRDLASTHRLPLKSLFARVARHARSLAEQQGKLVELTVTGADTEIDRVQADAMGDALLHIMRNAIDHGVELPAERQAQGKHERALLLLQATASERMVRVVVRDDGRGLDFAKIRARIVALGLSGETAASALGEEELVAFLFAPGFTTRDEVSSVSGRGVGLDVVRHRIAENGGSVSITGEWGKGTSVTIELPKGPAVAPNRN